MLTAALLSLLTLSAPSEIHTENNITPIDNLKPGQMASIEGKLYLKEQAGKQSNNGKDAIFSINRRTFYHMPKAQSDMRDILSKKGMLND